MRALARWIVPALLLAGCGTQDKTPPAEPGATAADPSAAAPGEGNPAAQGMIPDAAPALPPPGSGGPIQNGTTVHFHYKMLADGKVQMDTHEREPSTYVVGSGQMFAGLEQAMIGMKPGEKKTVSLKPEEAFGPRNEAAVQHVPRSNFPQGDSLKVGQVLTGQNQGRPVSATVQRITENDVVLDMNHPLAGKAVTFEIEIVSTQ